MPFPGRRVESMAPEAFGDVYTITEYLGNDMAVSYRYVFSPKLPLPEARKWELVEEMFQRYVQEGPR